MVVLSATVVKILCAYVYDICCYVMKYVELNDTLGIRACSLYTSHGCLVWFSYENAWLYI